MSRRAPFSWPQEQLEEMRRDDALYDKMARSVAPNVHGHSDVKRAVLLMLLGGMHKTTKEVGGGLAAVLGWCDAVGTCPTGGPALAVKRPVCPPLQGINLRGDINVAIVGDPACAKSQLLK